MNRLASFACPLIALLACVPWALGLTVKPNVGPVVGGPIGNYQQFTETTRVVDLSTAFSDPDASAAVRLNTSLGEMNFTLDGQQTPITVANFLRYLNEGRYFFYDTVAQQQASLFFHRSAANFVIQSGGFYGTVNPGAPTAVQATQVPTFAAIKNEPFLSNRRGTIAMAKLGGNADSATSQWFINLGDNSANLDSQNGGFTVFGRVAGNGMSVADAIGALPRYAFSSPFTELPLRDYTQSDYNSNKQVRVPNLVSIPEFTQISPLNFSASSNNNGVATATVSGTDLLVKAGTQLGSAQIDVTATDLDGVSVSQSFVVDVVAAPGRLRNIATRINFTSGSDVLIAGFILRGSAPKQLVVRAIGPSAQSATVPNVIANPSVELIGDGVVLASNDNWRNGPRQQLLADIGLAPTNDNEAALIATVPSSLDNKSYTAVVHSNGGSTGVGVVEVYDLDAQAGSSILNLSTRGQVGTGSDVLIGGFILGGTDSRRLVVRALGPSLAKQNVSGALSDPTITLRDGNGNIVDANDNWQTHPSAAEIQGYGLAPEDAKESAIISTLPAGNYTATIAGTGSAPTGVALIEIYQVQ